MLLYGPKAVGKSWVAAVLANRLNVFFIDADLLVLELLEKGIEPDARDGWLVPVKESVLAALAQTDLVCVEATGAWDSDWALAEELADSGSRVLRIWVWTTKDVAMGRLASRTARRAPVSVEEAAWIYDSATDRAARMHFDARIDTTGDRDSQLIVQTVLPLLTKR